MNDDLSRSAIDSAYCFFHQKWRVYEHSHSESQRDDIEYAIASYAQQMDPALYAALSQGNKDFLYSHEDFARDMQRALSSLEKYY